MTSYTPSDDIESIGDNFKVNLVNGEDTENIDFIFGENHLTRVNLITDENGTEIGVVKINDKNQDHNAEIGIHVFDENIRVSDLIGRQHDYKQIDDNRIQNLIYDLCKK